MVMRMMVMIRVAGVGWLSYTAAFVEPVFANFCDKNAVFCGKTGNLLL